MYDYQETIRDFSRYDELRAMINESVWIGAVNNNELISLKEIMQKKLSHNEEREIEAYLLLSNVIENDFYPKKNEKDQTIIVNRTNISFNDKECQ